LKKNKQKIKEIAIKQQGEDGGEHRGDAEERREDLGDPSKIQPLIGSLQP
jgi:hypothetical protein